ncbi:MAG: signal recognition particle protein [Coriobacteriales bacterium]|jgi:signal recognition particle subunit SRP54|nr:signal recognition particle protein [Coriobacteriales bacterium]
MFDNLSGRLQDVFGDLRSKGRLSESDIDAAMREIRLALLEADVNFKVVKGFVARAKEQAFTSEVLDSLTPAQNVIKIVLDELTSLLGSESVGLKLSSRVPNVIMLVGLQGSGKTTAAAKLAWRLKKDGHQPLLAACDIYRPAAADQLETLGKEIDVRVYRGDGKNAVSIAQEAVRDAIDNLRDVVIVDTAGRLHIDDEMMAEAKAIRDAVRPEQIIMVVDAMTGQDVVTVVQAFNEQVDFDGVIMSKMDGDARGGGALSIREMTGKPIIFTSEGEKPSSLEAFHPDRMAKRILGMGDMLTLIEKAQAAADAQIEQAEAQRIARAELTFDDFIMINRQVRKIGGISSLLKALPGGDAALAGGKVDENMLDRMEVIINSMTAKERTKPTLLNGSRRARIAAGAGVQVFDVNQLVKQFEETRKMMKKMGFGAEMLSKKTKRPKKGKKGKQGKQSKQLRAVPTLGGLGGGLSGSAGGGLGALGKAGKGGLLGKGAGSTGLGKMSAADLRNIEDLLK